ncbi:MAG TPA: glycosyltransferase, partial [Gemmatimonadaceae bacterium]
GLAGGTRMAEAVPDSAARVAGESVRPSGGGPAPKRLSVVVPTLNEGVRLPRLLACLSAQTRTPDEIIVADARSSDDTRAIAIAAGAKVVDGGDLLLFTDADSEPGPDFIERALAEFEARGLEVASAAPWPVETDPSLHFWCGVAEAYLRLMEHIVPHAAGVCILVTRELHERIGGFDETIVLAEDHDYARRAAGVGQYGLLRTVRVPASMRRAAHEGRWRLFGILVYTEWNTLAGKPIRSTPFEYRFGEFGEDDAPEGRGRGHRAPRRSGRAQRLLRQLEKPSSEVQTDAIGFQVVSAIGGGLGTAAMASAGWPPAAYVPFAGATAVIAGVSTYEALRKLRYERPYGDFFSASIAVASADVVDGSGRVLVRRGVDEVCELHAIKNLKRMSELNRQGLAGRLRIVLETLEGMRALIDDMGDAAYSEVSYVSARSSLTTLLFKVGFDEVEHPPPYDFVNRWDKRLLMWVIGRRVGRQLSGDAGSYRMALMPKQDFASARTAAAIDGQIERARYDLTRALSLSRRTEVPVPEATAVTQVAGE